MRHAYVRAMERERTAWRQFMLANACAAHRLQAYEGWRMAARDLQALAQELKEAGIEPPERFFLSSTSVARYAERHFASVGRECDMGPHHPFRA